MDDLYYSDYIELDKILNSQHPRSFEKMEDGNVMAYSMRQSMVDS